MHASKSAFAIVAVSAVVRAEPAPMSLDLEAAIAFAGAHHPAVRADAAAVRAASEDVDVERAKYTPDLEVFAQLGRATTNVVPGEFFAAPGLPVVGGTPGRSWDSVWNSEVGASASWDTLGFRKWDAMIDKARAEVQLARDDQAASALDVQYSAADRFVVVIERDQAVAAAKAGVDRAQVFLTIVEATVRSDLRAGADLSRAKAELAFAKTALARAQTARDMSLAELREALGAPDAQVRLEPGRLAGTPPAALAGNAGRDPHVVAAEDRVKVADAERRVIATGTQPKLALVGALFARGSGLLPGGVDSAHGLVPDAPNWVMGVLFTWPVLADRSVAPAIRAQEARVAREHAQQDRVAQQLAVRTEQARALLAGALAVADNTPAALQAAQDAEKQTVARFQAQLATADDVAQTQRLLVQAETDDALARLDVWRALLFSAYAAGDLAPFLAQYRGASR